MQHATLPCLTVQSSLPPDLDQLISCRRQASTTARLHMLTGVKGCSTHCCMHGLDMCCACINACSARGTVVAAHMYMHALNLAAHWLLCGMCASMARVCPAHFKDVDASQLQGLRSTSHCAQPTKSWRRHTPRMQSKMCQPQVVRCSTSE